MFDLLLGLVKSGQEPAHVMCAPSPSNEAFATLLVITNSCSERETSTSSSIMQAALLSARQKRQGPVFDAALGAPENSALRLNAVTKVLRLPIRSYSAAHPQRRRK
eukprot:TRINITY_DN6729_c0_g1_i1.p2 TRINITY_DN6729_c0_g1~~TRINITY_DN6729_c0_g1_i1.p2  ORF type:complete len:106 (-),score=20.70 TRINITY_DN6729_c0_g1_i1:129-446(-)